MGVVNKRATLQHTMLQARTEASTTTKRDCRAGCVEESAVCKGARTHLQTIRQMSLHRYVHRCHSIYMPVLTARAMHDVSRVPQT